MDTPAPRPPYAHPLSAGPTPLPPQPDRAPHAQPPARSHWTPAKQRVFLSALVETGSVAQAARAAGMSRSSANRLRLRLAGTPFDAGWDHALALHAQRLADPFASEPAQPRRAAAAPEPRT